MNASLARIGAALRVGPRWALLFLLCGILGVMSVAALATRFSVLPATLALALVTLGTVVSLRWPLLMLSIFVALVPIEQVLLVDDVGTISRFAGVLFAVSYGVPRLGHLAFGAMPPAAWAYLAWAGVSIGWALSPATAWAQLSTLFQLFLVAFLVADFVVHRPAIARHVLWVYSLSAAATALIGTQSYIARGIGSVRAVAIEGQDPAQFAAVLLPALVFGLSEFLNGSRRILGGSIALITTAAVVVSGTRGAWVAVLTVVVLVVLPQLTLRRRVAAVVSIVVLLASVYQLPGVPELVTERSGNAISTGGAGRTDIWSVGLMIFVSAPLIGVGYANFPVAYTLDTVRAVGSSSAAAYVDGRAPHNLVVGTMVELGTIGLFLLGLFLLPLLARGGFGPNAATVRAALASLYVQAMFLDILANRKQVWLVVGLAAGLAYAARSEPLTRIGSRAPSERSTDARSVDGPSALSRRRAPRLGIDGIAE